MRWDYALVFTDAAALDTNYNDSPYVALRQQDGCAGPGIEARRERLAGGVDAAPGRRLLGPQHARLGNH